MEAQLKLRYSQEGLKKAQRGPDWLNRCFGSSKALVPWLCHTLQVKHEAEGGLLRRGSANWGCFLCSGCHRSLGPLLQASGGRKAVVFARGGAGEHSAAPHQIFFAVSPSYSENSTSNGSLGRKLTRSAVWKEGLTSLPCIAGSRSSELVWTGENFHTSVCCLETTGRG